MASGYDQQRSTVQQRSYLPGAGSGHGSAASGSYHQAAQTAHNNANNIVSAPYAQNTPLNLPHLQPGPLDLGFIPAASTSQTSLLEAVVGPDASTTASARRLPLPPSSFDARVASSAAPRMTRDRSTDQRDSSSGSRSFGTSTEREWDVLSDASVRLNEGADVDPEVVEELQQKVNKRKSNLPHLESELAALEAQIKAAEERIARAQQVKKPLT